MFSRLRECPFQMYFICLRFTFLFLLLNFSRLPHIDRLVRTRQSPLRQAFHPLLYSHTFQYIFSMTQSCSPSFRFESAEQMCLIDLHFSIEDHSTVDRSIRRIDTSNKFWFCCSVLRVGLFGGWLCCVVRSRSKWKILPIVVCQEIKEREEKMALVLRSMYRSYHWLFNEYKGE